MITELPQLKIRNHPDAILVKMTERRSNLIEETEFNKKSRQKKSVQDINCVLVAVARKAVLENTDTYQCFFGIFP
jgi:hypothetical protein